MVIFRLMLLMDSPLCMMMLSICVLRVRWDFSRYGHNNEPRHTNVPRALAMVDSYLLHKVKKYSYENRTNIFHSKLF